MKRELTTPLGRPGLLPFWLAVVIVCSAAPAHAGGLVIAPICDPSGASAPAPAPALPSHGGEIIPYAPCPAAWETTPAHGLPRQSSDKESTAHGDSALLLVFDWASPAPAVLPAPNKERGHLAPGFALPVYRPPRA
jgi:hypothetical protein